MTVQEVYNTKIFNDAKVKFAAFKSDGSFHDCIQLDGTFGYPLSSVEEPMVYPEALMNATIIRMEANSDTSMTIVLGCDDLDNVWQQLRNK